MALKISAARSCVTHLPEPLNAIDNSERKAIIARLPRVRGSGGAGGDSPSGRARTSMM